MIWTQPSGPLCLWQCFSYSLQTRDLYLPSWIENFLYSNTTQRGRTNQNIKFSCMSILYTLRVMCFWWSKAGGESNRSKKWNLPNSFSTANLSNNLSTHENATQSCDAKGNIVFFPKTEKMIKSIEHFMLLKVILN